MRKIRLPFRPAGLVLWGVLLLLLIAIFVLVRTRTDAEPDVETESRPLPVHVIRIEPRAVADTLSLPGRLDAARDARLAAERAGRITALLVDRGDAVREGVPLLHIDDRVWETHLARAEVELREAARELNRLTELQKTGAVSDREFDLAAARAEMAKAGVEEARTHVEQCTIRAPFDGIIEDRHVELGEHVNEGREAFRLVAIQSLRLRFTIPERDVGTLAAGDTLAFTLDALPGEPFQATVRFVAQTADLQSNAYRVEAEIDNASGRLRAGMIARVELTRRVREAALSVPLSAILPRRGEDVVFLVEDDRAVRRVVAIDALIGTDAVLARGVSAGDLLVVEGHRDLADGARVIRVGDDAPGSTDP